MQFLDFPCTPAEDDKTIKTLCKKPEWQAHEAAWLGTYTAYRAAGSNPWTVTPTAFQPDVAEEQRDLYRTRKNGGPIRRIRLKQGLLSCPLCGSPTTGHVDHLLPREPYAEFSILRANLVPACGHCNSAGKGNKHRGSVQPERFIHPYFDQFAAGALWRVRIIPPYAAVTFEAEPLPNLQGDELSIVRYHLKNVLGTQFKSSMSTFWSTYPSEIKEEAGGGPVTAALMIDIVEKHIRVRTNSTGINSWYTAMLRGIRADQAAMDYLAQQAAVYPTP